MSECCGLTWDDGHPSTEGRLASLEAALIDVRKRVRRAERDLAELSAGATVAKRVADELATRNSAERNGRFSRREQLLAAGVLAVMVVNTMQTAGVFR
jgi:hypothetical protein